MMVKFKTILRIMWASKRLHLINIGGLSIGLCLAILIAMFVFTEKSYDKHIVDYNNKYRLLKSYGQGKESIFPYIASTILRQDIPEISSFCLIDHEGSDIKYKDNYYSIENIVVSDSTFIDMFSLTMIEGNDNHFLTDPNTCILSKNTAQKIFGNNNPVGQVINFGNEYDCTVIGVYNDIPYTTHLNANIVVSISSWYNISWRKRFFSSWGNQGSLFYVSVTSNSDKQFVEKKLTDAFIKNAGWFKGAGDEDTKGFKIELQPLKNIYLHSSSIQWDNFINKNDLSTIKILSIIGVIAIFMACFNYINLNTAYSQIQNKIAGIQRVLGAKRIYVIKFFFIQTLIIFFISLVFALIFLLLAIPYFNQIVDGYLQFHQVYTLEIAGIIIGIILSTILISGIYPSVILASGNTVSLMRGSKTIRPGSSVMSLRSVLITIQFVISICLFVCLLTMNKQIKLLISENLGFNKEKLVQIDLWGDKKDYDYLSDEFRKIPGIQDVTAASNMPCEYINNENPLFLVGSDNNNPPQGCLVGIEPDFFEVFNTSIIEGNGFNNKLKSKRDEVLISEITKKRLGLENPVGAKLRLMGRTYTVIGTVEDIQYRTLREASLPTLYSLNYNNYRKIALRVKSTDPIRTLSAIKEIWNERFPDRLIDMKFFDEKIKANYQKELSYYKLFTLLVILGIIIVVLGLIGLMRFFTDRRIKEIGIRKVNGAKVRQVLILLNNDIVIWVIVALIIAGPTGYFSISKWLENYAYRTDIDIHIFLFAGLVAFLIIFITVSLQSWRAARRNPVEALRYE